MKVLCKDRHFREFELAPHEFTFYTHKCLHCGKYLSMADGHEALKNHTCKARLKELKVIKKEV